MAGNTGLSSPLIKKDVSPSCSSSSAYDPWSRTWENAGCVDCAEDIDEAWLAMFPLRTQGRHIVDQGGVRFRLKGVNWYGASDVLHVVGGLDTQTLDEICLTVHNLGFNVVRLPFSNEMLRCFDVPDGAINYVLNPKLRGLSPLEVYDAVVHCLGLHTVTVIVNNHTTYGEFCGPPSNNSLWFDPSSTFTEEQWLADWRMMARRYARCLHVVGYDLRNELRPRGAMWPSWSGANDSHKWRGRCNWARAAREAARTVLAESPDALIVVERIVWPQRALKDYPGLLLPELEGHLVLGAHMYHWSGPGRFIPDWACPRRWMWVLKLLRVFRIISPQNYGHMHPESLREQVAQEVGDVLKEGHCPVWISEFGADLSNIEEMRWLKDFVGILAEHEADWAYWPLNVGPKPECGGDEAYGMLAACWKPKHEGDRRLELMEQIGLVRPDGAPVPEKAQTPTRARPPAMSFGTSNRKMFSQKNPLPSIMSRPNFRELAEAILPMDRFPQGPKMTRRATVPYKLSMIAEEAQKKDSGGMRRVTSHAGTLSPSGRTFAPRFETGAV